jgi:hypothetical protein
MKPSKPPPPNARKVDQNRLVQVGGRIDRGCASLRLFGDSLDPDEITRLLGCHLTESRRKGDVIPDKRYHRVASTGSWRLDGALPDTTDIEEQLLGLLAAVTSDLKVWRRLTGEFDVDIFCGLFLDECNRGFSLSPQLSRMLGERGIEVGFDVYGP